MITEMLASPLMQRALIAAVLVGLAAPGGGHIPGAAWPGADG